MANFFKKQNGSDGMKTSKDRMLWESGTKKSGSPDKENDWLLDEWEPEAEETEKTEEIEGTEEIGEIEKPEKSEKSEEEALFEELDVGGGQSPSERPAVKKDPVISGQKDTKDAKDSFAGRRKTKELNTAGTSIDRRKSETEKAGRKHSLIRRVILCTVIEMLTLAAIFAYGYVKRMMDQIVRPEIDIEAVENSNISLEKKKEMEGCWNLAVFGVDGRGNDTVSRGLNSDVIMIVSINKDNGDIKLCSVFRDTLLNINDSNTYAKINAAYAQGGPEQALAALNKNLDLNITNYVTFNWKAVADGINILGGVDDIEISKAEFYYINAYITETVKATKIGSVQLTSPGVWHLDGVQAVAYGRLRYMDSDFARTERQKNIIKACFKKAKQADFSVLNNIMVVCFPQVATNIGMNDVVDLARNIMKYNIAETGGFPWSRGDAVIGNKGDCVIPTTLESNVIMLHSFLFGDENYQPSDAVLTYSQTIKEKSSLYKEGTPVDSVRTDQGIIPKPKTETKSADKQEKESEGYTFGVDEEGNLVYPTDEDGSVVMPTDESGHVVYPTDSDGNVILPKDTRPTEDGRPTEGGDRELFEAPGEGGPDTERIVSPAVMVIGEETENDRQDTPNRDPSGQLMGEDETTIDTRVVTDPSGKTTGSHTSDTPDELPTADRPGGETESESAGNKGRTTPGDIQGDSPYAGGPGTVKTETEPNVNNNSNYGPGSAPVQETTTAYYGPGMDSASVEIVPGGNVVFID